MNRRTDIALKGSSPVCLSLRGASAAGLEVDRTEGVIRNVPVITVGTTLPPGSGGAPFNVDRITLQQVADAINSATDGVRSRLTHPELEGIDPIRVMVGSWRNARIDGDRTVADFHIGSYAAHTPQGNAREFLLGLAEEGPSFVGTSITASEAWFESDPNVETGQVLRLRKLKSVDWVGEPAANPTGMLNARADNQKAGGTDASGAVATQAKGIAMNYNARQLEYLRSVGLGPDATPEEIASFVEGLTAEQAAELAGMADAAASASAPAPAPAPAAPAAAAAASAKPASNPVVASAAAPAGMVSLAKLAVFTEIGQLADMPGSWAGEMALAGKTEEEARQIALAEKAKRKTPVPMAGSGDVNVGANRSHEALNAAVRDGIALRAGNRDFFTWNADGRPGLLGGTVALSADGGLKRTAPHDLGRKFATLPVIEMGRRYLVSLGYTAADFMARTDLARLLMSKSLLRSELARHGCVFLAQATGDFPYLLADAMGKSLRQAYATASPTWPLWCRRATAPDFKTIKRNQLSEAPTLTEIVEGAEYTYGNFTEGRETYQLAKYGKGVVFTREMLINDDLDAFSRVPTMFGRAASRLEETTAIAILTANAVLSDSVALFATAHNNLTTGALSVASLGTARGVMRKQTPLGGDSSNPLELTPRVLIVPEELSATAEQLVGATVDPAKYNNTPNLAFIQRLVVASSARLSASSAAIWYLAADYNEIDTVEMAFLEGEEGPTIEEEDEFDTDARKVKVRHHVAAKAIDYRGLVRSSGS